LERRAEDTLSGSESGVLVKARYARQNTPPGAVVPITTEEGVLPSVETTPPAYSGRREGIQKAAEMVIASLPVVGGALQIAFQDAMGRSLVARREQWLSYLAESLNDPTDLAFFYCYSPPGRPPATLPVLVRTAGMRWQVEEDFRTGKDHFGLDHSQVRLYTALLRHLTLTMAALTICALTAAAIRPATSTLPPPPLDPHQPPPPEPGLVPLGVAEVKRLFNLATRTIRDLAHHLRWAWWRRRHQARARWFHHRARLRRRLLTP